MALPEYKSQKTKVWQYLNQPLSVLKSALGITDGGGGGDYLTTTVTVSAADLIAAGPPPVTVKELLPAPGVGKYYNFGYVQKVKNGTVAYNTVPACSISGVATGASCGIPSTAADQVISGAVLGSLSKLNEPIELKLVAGSAITSGDADLIFEIEYKILDF